MPGIEELAAAVQRNCDLADAVHAQDLSLCTYLLQMREFFRWERDLPLDLAPDRGEVGRWIAMREAHWEALAEQADAAFAALPIGEGVDAFDEAAVNERLGSLGFVYAAGLARFRRPEFVLAERVQSQAREGATVIVTGREHARGLNPPMATSRGDQVLVRRDVLRRWLGTRLELSRQRPSAEGLCAAVDAWRVDDDREAALERITAAETETLILHELGERRAAALLGAQWEEMLAALDDHRSEIVARAIRDLLADCESTLPTLLERDERASIHFWFANLEGMRGLLAPDLRAGYLRWRGAGPGAQGASSALADAISAQREHWLAQARRMLDAWREGATAGAVAFSEALVDAARGESPPG
ncbi:MAG: hypothetical protein KF786_13255 [Burkholderiaceae bacterium]|jgi:hypothetical protein|nr:hypothetical protein [Burkholderiaceae bacterium]